MTQNRQEYYREYNKAYKSTENGLAARKAADKRFKQSEKGKEKKRIQDRRYRLQALGWSEERWLVYNYAQGGLCYFCGKSNFELGLNRELSADHSHKTGEPRALLCNICNTRIGYFERDFHLVLNYLKEKESK